MLSYELCQRLKSVGFPQIIPEEFGDEQSRWWCSYGKKFSVAEPPKSFWCQTDGFNDDGTHGEDHECKVLCKDPTIEDLIRELGDDILELCLPAGWAQRNHGTVCGAIVNGVKNPQLAGKFYEGDSPEEALANLYLALHPDRTVAKM